MEAELLRNMFHPACGGGLLAHIETELYVVIGVEEEFPNLPILPRLVY